MGSWNQTCAISNLPIRYSEDIICLFIVNNFASGHSEGSTHCYHRVLPLYIAGQYNDYGVVENIENCDVSEYVLARFRKNIKINVANDDDDDDIVDSNDLDKLDWDEFFKNQRKNRLELPMPNWIKKGAPGTPLHHLQINANVFNRIIEEHVVSISRPCDNYHSNGVSFSTIMEDYDNFYHIMTEGVHTTDIHLLLMSSIDTNNYILLMLEQHLNWCKSIPCFNIKHMLLDNIKTISKEQLYVFIEQYVKMGILEDFMSVTHRTWAFPGYAGQTSETEGHSLLASITIDEIERIQTWDEEY